MIEYFCLMNIRVTEENRLFLFNIQFNKKGLTVHYQNSKFKQKPKKEAFSYVKTLIQFTFLLYQIFIFILCTRNI